MCYLIHFVVLGDERSKVSPRMLALFYHQDCIR